MAFKTSKIEYVIKLYNSAGTYQRVLTEVNEGITIEKSLFGGSGPLTLILNQKIDELPSDITFNAKIKIFRKDAFNSNPIQVYYGYIVSIDPIITEREELTRITCLGSISKLKNDFLRQTSNYEGSPLAYEIEPAYIDEHIKEILSHYRDLINSHYGSYSYSMIDDPDNYWSDTNYIQSTSDIGKIPYRYFNLKHLDAIREIAKFLPKNDSANDYWFWYLDDTGRFHLKKLSTTPDHILYLRKHLTSLEARKNIEGVINKVFFWNEKGSAAKQIMLIEDDSNSQDKYDIIADRITDSQIYFKDAAELYAQARLKENSEYKAEATIVVSSDKYDICSFHPGDVVSIRDVKDTNLFPSRMIIQRLILKENEAVLELSTPRPDLTTQVEQDRQFVENQLKWFGEILTRIDGTRIHTGVQHWTQEGIVFTPTSNDTVEWSEGVFYLPNDVWRVVTSNSITVSEDTILYVDEANVYCTKDTGKAAVASGTGSIKAGENFLVDSSANWETDQYKGYALWVNPSGGSAEKHIISRNTQTVLYIEAHDPFDTTDSNCSYEIHKLELRSTTKLRASGTADSGTTTTVVDSERTEANDFWNGYEIKFTSGDNAGLTRRVIDFDASADTLTLDRALPNAVSSGDKYQLYLSPENQILIADVLPDSDANNKAQIIERSSAVSDSTTAATGGKKANEALTDDYYIKRVIRSDKIEFADPECTGLNLTNTYMGYYDGMNWKAYIDKNGNFYFGGDASNYIQWNGSTLTIRGSLTADDIETGTLSGILVEGSTIQTDSSGHFRLVMKSSEELYFPNALSFMSQTDLDMATITGAIDGSMKLASQNDISYIYVLSAVPQVGIKGKLVPVMSGYDLGSSTAKWQNLYLSGNIEIDGTVDGIDISSHAENASAHHSKTTYSSELTVNSDWDMNTYDIIDLKFLKFNPTYGQIHWGTDLFLDLYSSEARYGKHLVPRDLTLNLNLGSASLYWNEINYKYLTDRGCLGVFDKGVEMPNGKVVSDLTALKLLKKHPVLKTGYGVPRFDYSSMPKAVFKPAPIAEKDVYDKDGKLIYRKNQKMGEDGAELTALISIMIGAIKELDKKVETLEAKIK